MAKKNSTAQKLRPYSGKAVDSFRRSIENMENYSGHRIAKLCELINAEFLQDHKTPDEREWYAGLELVVDGGAKLAVLFPWTVDQRKEHPISVYTDKPIPEKTIAQTLDIIARTYSEIKLR